MRPPADNPGPITGSDEYPVGRSLTPEEIALIERAIPAGPDDYAWSEVPPVGRSLTPEEAAGLKEAHASEPEPGCFAWL